MAIHRFSLAGQGFKLVSEDRDSMELGDPDSSCSEQNPRESTSDRPVMMLFRAARLDAADPATTVPTIAETGIIS